MFVRPLNLPNINLFLFYSVKYLKIMKSNFALLIFLVGLTPALFAQQPFCGMPMDHLHQVKAELLKNREEMKNFVFNRNAVTYVPVRFFLVADSDGSGRGTERSCLTALCNLNTNYKDLDIQFYLKEFKYINHGTIYDNPMSFSGSNAIANQMIYDAINVFVVDDAGGGAAAYFQPPYGPSGNDWIVCAKQYMTDVRVLSHEFGHFFSLPHTFNGWEPQQWDEAINGNPVTQFYAPDGTTQVELVNGSNCNIAGDGICDTPADYLFPSGNCSYNLSVMDKNGDLLTPQIENYMNYHFGCSQYFFTDDQKQAIKTSLFSFNRNYIRPNYTPVTDEITEQPTVISPQNNEQLNYNKNVYLSWTAVPGAQFYLVDILSGTTKIRKIVSENSLLLEDDLQPDKTYLWKVMPFNESYGCAQFSSSFKFRTGDGLNSVAKIDEVTGFELSPNPAAAGTDLQIRVLADKNFVADVSLVSLTGRPMNIIRNYEFRSGQTALSLPTTNLPAGVYFVRLQSEKGVLNQKIVLTR
ncbi:MAG: T9SS C-terminal target domain-containing protein [Bacteroidetes bacterium]|nr:MAG: T9SS C-terminal target domain-containing protein [Bacteroidota bacterium]